MNLRDLKISCECSNILCFKLVAIIKKLVLTFSTYENQSEKVFIKKMQFESFKTRNFVEIKIKVFKISLSVLYSPPPPSPIYMFVHMEK